jgi:hypothetical protein
MRTPLRPPVKTSQCTPHTIVWEHRPSSLVWIRPHDPSSFACSVSEKRKLMAQALEDDDGVVLFSHSGPWTTTVYEVDDRRQAYEEMILPLQEAFAQRLDATRRDIDFARVDH